MNITGIVENIRFVNEENGYCIITFDSDCGRVIAVGVFPPVCEGERLSLAGEFTVHPRYGRQFSVVKVRREKPRSPAETIRFLGSGLFKGIGEKTAERIVDMFGTDALDIMANKPELLAKVKGISAAKARRIAEDYAEKRGAQDAVMYLQDKGVSLSLAMKIYKIYGSAVEATISANPYKLIEDVDGVGFLTADRIAESVGVAKDSEFRLRAGLIYSLKDSGERSGNTFLYKDELLENARELLQTEGDYAAALDSLVVDRKVKTVDIDGKTAVYMISAFSAEKNAAVRLVELEAYAQKFEGAEKEIDEYEKVYGIEFNDEQRRALGAAVNNGVCVITGGPGTGKTTIIRCLISLLEQRGQDILLVAPTGRAAKRMSEASDRPAYTIHRALMGDEGPGSAQIAATAVIVDETSMVDIYLFNMLLKALRDGTRLILLGDKNQLPSVGAGNVLADIIEKLPTVELTRIYRQKDASLIISNAHAVNRGEMPELRTRDKDFFFIEVRDQERIAEQVLGLVQRRLPKYLDIEPSQIQVLCAMKRGAAGVNALNKLLEERLNPDGGESIAVGEIAFKAGDKVMQTVNNYHQQWRRGAETGEGVFNGDMGFVTEVYLPTRELRVKFEDGREAVYTDNLDELMPAYAITVHKSQGSEFDAVIIPTVVGSPVIMTRNLLYTAITRAKRLVVLVGEEYAVKRMVENNYIACRNSGLKYFIDRAREDYKRLFG